MPKPRYFASFKILKDDGTKRAIIIYFSSLKKGDRYSFEVLSLLKNRNYADVLVTELFQIPEIKDCVLVDDKIEFYLKQGEKLTDDLVSKIKDIFQKVYDKSVGKTSQPVVQKSTKFQTSNLQDLKIMPVWAIINQLSWSDGLKKSMIKDFEDSGYAFFKDLVKDNARETSKAIQDEVIGFASGKNTYLQADMIANKLFTYYNPPKQAPIESEWEENPSEKTIHCIMIGDKFNTGMVGQVITKEKSDSDNEEDLNYLVYFESSNAAFRFNRKDFIVEGDIVRANPKANYAILIVKIIPEILQIEIKVLSDDPNPTTTNLSLTKIDFRDYSIEVFYQLHELFESKEVEPKEEPKKAPSKPLSDDEKEIESLKKEVSNLVFLKQTFSPIEFEEVMKVGQKIDEKQKKINDLNVVIVDKKLKGNQIFDDLFEQSFADIKNSYNVYVESETENTEFFAPNGDKSELKNSINSIIRTPLFKDWFGDWQLAYQYRDIPNSGFDCSKVITKNFEPLIVWHGTGTEFSYFKFDRFPAAYFAVNKDYSEWFAHLQSGGQQGYTLPFFLNLRNPLDLTKFGTTEIKGSDFLDYMFVMTGMSPEELEINPIFLDPSTPKVQTWVYIRNSPKMLKKLAESHVFDGIHFYETNPSVPVGEPAHQTEAYITFKPDSCKIADPERGDLILAAMKSFLLKKGGKI